MNWSKWQHILTINHSVSQPNKQAKGTSSSSWPQVRSLSSKLKRRNAMARWHLWFLGLEPLFWPVYGAHMHTLRPPWAFSAHQNGRKRKAENGWKTSDMSYGQNLVHGEGTSLSRVGPYWFCNVLQWQQLGQTFLKNRFGYCFRVGPYRFCSNLNTTLVIPNFVQYSCMKKFTSTCIQNKQQKKWNPKLKFQTGPPPPISFLKGSPYILHYI